MGSPAKGDDDNKGANKRRFELKFSDVEKIEISTDTNTMTIGTIRNFIAESDCVLESKEKPAEYKEHNTQLKKNPQWIKETTYGELQSLESENIIVETESEFGEDDGKNGIYTIVATFAKDTLTKSQQGKMSHLDKLKRCEFNLFVDGKLQAQDSVPSTPLKTGNTMGFGQGEMHPFAQPPMNFNSMLQMKKEMSFPGRAIMFCVI